MDNTHTKIDRKKVINSLFWKYMERGGTQGVQFVVSIILARLLSPNEYGIIAIVMVFITLSNVFVQSGFNTALIQKRTVDHVDFSSVFILSFLIAFLLYVMLFVSAPWIATFYNNLQLIAVIRVLSITLFFGAFNSIQNAYLTKHMMFKKLFYRSFLAMIISGIVGIITAYFGWGVWALVAQQLSSKIAIVLILWYTVEWKPSLVFSFERIKGMFSFGSRMLVSSLINVLYLDLRTLIIGRMYSSATLGYFNRGQQFPKLIVDNINGSIQSVMLPTLSAHQEDLVRVKSIVRRSIKTSSFIVFPMMVGLALVAESLVLLLLTEKWISSVPFLQMFSIAYAMMPVHSANLQAINAIGRSDIFLKLEIYKKTLGLFILVISIPFGVHAIALGVVFSSMISMFINAYPNKKLIGYALNEQWQDVASSLMITLMMAVIVYFVGMMDMGVFMKLFIQIVVGASSYFGLAYVLKIENLDYLFSTIKEFLEVKKA